MTPEELQLIKLNWYGGIVRCEDVIRLWQALDAARKERDELKETVEVLSDRLADMAVERDGFKGRLNDIYSVVNLGVASPRT